MVNPAAGRGRAARLIPAVRDAFARQNWNAFGLAAVHCAISASDALLVKAAGVRSASESHHDVAALLKEKIASPETAEQARRLEKILSKKNLIEYQDREFTPDEAYALQKDVERYYSWATDRLSKLG